MVRLLLLSYPLQRNSGINKPITDGSKDYEKIVFFKFTPKQFRVHMSLRSCKNFKEISECLSELENKIVTPEAVRKRAERAFKQVKNLLVEKYEAKKTIL